MTAEEYRLYRKELAAKTTQVWIETGGRVLTGLMGMFGEWGTAGGVLAPAPSPAYSGGAGGTGMTVGGIPSAPWWDPAKGQYVTTQSTTAEGYPSPGQGMVAGIKTGTILLLGLIGGIIYIVASK